MSKFQRNLFTLTACVERPIRSPVASGTLGAVHGVLHRLLVLECIQLVLRQVPAAVFEHEGARGDELAGDDAVAEPRARVQARPEVVLSPGLRSQIHQLADHPTILHVAPADGLMQKVFGNMRPAVPR